MQSTRLAVLVTGATGYIGGRLTPRLIDEGHRVGVLVRNAARVRSRSWAERVEIVEGDALDRDTLSRALAGVDCAYYLIHSMGSGAGFHELDVEAARLFGQVAGEAGVRRIVYLGGLGDPKADLSRHLRSRQKTGRALREGGVPVTEFRAAVIVGSGSISFEMIRYLVERLPVMVVYRVFTGIGGDRGWFHGDWMWQVRGMVDRMLGGAGLRRGRRHPDELRIGDALDFWRVEALEPGRLVRLRAEMKLPGRAWLRFRVWETEEGTTRLEQTAPFLPKGLGGLLYWYGLYPVHARICDGLAREIARRAEAGRG